MQSALTYVWEIMKSVKRKSLKNVRIIYLFSWFWIEYRKNNRLIYAYSIQYKAATHHIHNIMIKNIHLYSWYDCSGRHEFKWEWNAKHLWIKLDINDVDGDDDGNMMMIFVIKRTVNKILIAYRDG